jgi:hypothetical protein
VAAPAWLRALEARGRSRVPQPAMVTRTAGVTAAAETAARGHADAGISESYSPRSGPSADYVYI